MKRRITMSEEKFEVYKQMSICGTLDLNHDGEKVIIVEGQQYKLNKILDDMMGNQIEIKSQIEV